MGDLDTYLRLLADESKREILVSLLETDDEEVSVASDDAQEHIRRHHIHLPKLADAGLIEWQQGENTVERGPAFDEVVPLLEAIGDIEERD